MRKMSHKPVGVDVLGDPFRINIIAVFFYIAHTHNRGVLSLPQWGKVLSVSEADEV